MRTSTRTRLGAVVLGAALCAALVPAAAASGSPAIPLNVGQETTGSNTGAHGFFSYEISGDQLCYTMSARNLSVPAVAAHIHVGERKVAGPIVVPLDVGTGTTWSISDCVTADPALLAAIEASPRDYYINVHTPTFPGGEIRGHLK
ncbi:CHRD domain containing protein [Beutenbergia cavernae DSM 12333]|uniref:CHRD domain containing protein n=1 Tax=Beutenbergia cavernae (strain ATCC BAA-8 / DSM 12333 / CCUG 43141 / JCM 11478 / NBRC 16432 / NCIMB 13614 / HKI 0122) TaxID=471853 RepID=C5C555_BEUC1|nr:CHRD domain-containing protein [Beutenbergia cavernae]ACQ82195.1 CHRD domain containing protein [Beutenbergia cavernae DSM 12333]